MFTGLVETLGTVGRVERARAGLRLELRAPELESDLAVGDSIAVDGACLTVARLAGGAFLVDVSGETAQRTTLGGLAQGRQVNLERALRLSDRLGGHLVSGHIDGVGTLIARRQAGNATLYRFGAPREIMEYVVPKGSIAVDGISLTVADVGREDFGAAVIPHTERATTLHGKSAGAAVNVEVDMLGKLVRRFVALYLGADEAASRGGGGRSGHGGHAGHGGHGHGSPGGASDLLRALVDEGGGT